MIFNRRWCLSVIIMIAVAAMLSSGCRRVEDTLYLKYADIGMEGWRQNEPLCYEPQSADTTLRGTRTDMTLMVRYRTGYPLPPLRLVAVAEDVSGELMCDTVKVSLFGNDGTPLVKQRHGICETSLPLMTDLPMRKGLSVCLLPLSPDSLTRGIVNIGIKLSTHGSDSITSRTSRRTGASSR